MTYFYVYLWACLAIFAIWIVRGAYEDLFKGPDHKFGYNYKSGMFWLMAVWCSFPIVNVISVICLKYGHYKDAVARKRDKAERAERLAKYDYDLKGRE